MMAPLEDGNVQRFLPVPVGDEIGAQKQHGDRCARRDAHDGPRRAELSGIADVEHVPRYGRPMPSFNSASSTWLTAVGVHVALTLRVAPHTGQQAHAEHRWGHAPDGGAARELFRKRASASALENISTEHTKPRPKKQPDGGGEDPPLLVFQPLAWA